MVGPQAVPLIFFESLISLFFSFLFLSTNFAPINYAQAKTIDQFFQVQKSQLPKAGSSAKHTFIIWINGDSDHFQTRLSTDVNSESTNLNQGANSKLYRVDAVDESLIRNFAKHCQECNVVELHDQLGSDYWYTRRKPWGVYLRAFSRGHRVLKRSAKEIDETNPNVLTRLIALSAQLFPQSQLHLVYRGHAFPIAAVPDKALWQEQVVQFGPFDRSQPNSLFSLKEFVEGIKNSGRRLASVTMAACNMAYWEAAVQLSPYTNFLVAPQLSVLETLEVGFNFDFLMSIRDQMCEKDVVEAISSRLLSRFEQTPFLTEAMMEYPLTTIELKDFDKVELSWQLLQQRLTESSLSLKERAHLEQVSVIIKSLSSRYVRNMSTPDESFIEALRLPDILVPGFDLIQYLREYQKVAAGDSREVEAFLGELQSRVHVKSQSPYSRVHGLNFLGPRF